MVNTWTDHFEGNFSWSNATMVKKTLKIFTAEEGGAEHCQVDDRQAGVNMMADWLSDTVFGKRRPAEGRRRLPRGDAGRCDPGLRCRGQPQLVHAVLEGPATPDDAELARWMPRSVRPQPARGPCRPPRTRSRFSASAGSDEQHRRPDSSRFRSRTVLDVSCLIAGTRAMSPIGAWSA